ncbi:helix-turn-helix transcriptional regulator [Paraburkholderia dilworthii]|uniref:helix-turn-helix transcriptional regulator n=1 Tax=Paraburkholderia dilworthii TaxID=948106 RepID=UPI0012686BE2|nr:helix-turn-helix transcriptional regulator [Paraburkholderia dilworthii]
MDARPASKPNRNPVLSVLGKRVRECRLAAGLSQERLAHEALIDRTYVSAVERGKANPSVLTVANICHALGIHLSELFHPLDISERPDGSRRAAPQRKQADVKK